MIRIKGVLFSLFIIVVVGTIGVALFLILDRQQPELQENTKVEMLMNEEVNQEIDDVVEQKRELNEADEVESPENESVNQEIDDVVEQKRELNEADEVESPENEGLDEESIMLKIPVIEYKNGNVLSEPIIKDYNQDIIRKTDEFVIDPATLGYQIGNSVGAIKLQLVDILPDSIVVDVLADARFDGNFYPRDEIERYDIKSGSCVSAFPLVVDAYYEYCFELSKIDSQMTLEYNIRRESTMPSP